MTHGNTGNKNAKKKHTKKLMFSTRCTLEEHEKYKALKELLKNSPP